MRVTQQFQSASAYQCLQWRIDLDKKYANPFDPDQIAVDATFTGADGRKIVMPGFWDQPPSQEGHFVVRVAAPVIGKWTVQVRARDVDGIQQSPASTFEVVASKSKGFIHPAKNHRYFQYDSGKSFFILGLNLAWGGKEGIKSYEKWFPDLAQAGGNFARVWLTYPAMENLATGLGKYDQKVCQSYDQIFQSAQNNGIACLLTLNNYRDLILRDEWGSAEWPKSVYNSANGGPATRPADFLTNAECQRLYRQRLRYIVARWGAYTSVFGWEFWNEQTFAGVPISPAWTQSMARYLQKIDPYHHPISTSFGANDLYEVWRLPEIGFTQEHIYPGPEIFDGSPVFASATYFDRQFDKPSLIAECGIGGKGPDTNYDKSGHGTNFHNGLWSAMMAGSAGGACIWWWDNYVAPKNLWHVFTGASRFASQIDWAKRDFEPVELTAVINPKSETRNPKHLDTVRYGQIQNSKSQISNFKSQISNLKFDDIVISAGQGWGRSHGKTIHVLPNGQTMLLPPQYIYGPEQKALRTPTVLSIDLPRASQMIVRVVKVSDYGVLRVYVDGKPVKDFAFSALPASVEKGGKTHKIPQGIYQATIQKDCMTDLPAGQHTIELSDIAGDWLAIQSITFTNARSSKYADIYIYALIDKKAGRLIAWLHNPQSNWRNDADGKSPTVITDADLAVPVMMDGTYTVQWWDTYTGEVVKQGSRSVMEGKLSLPIPDFTRDIALRIWPNQPPG